MNEDQNSAAPRILVVEDEAVIAMDIEDRLERMGYDVVGNAANGDRAIKLAEHDEPDLTLMDIHIRGDRDGIEIAAIFASDFDIPCVFLTAYSDEATIQRAIRTQANGYLLKPFQDREMRATIELALFKHKTERQLTEYRTAIEEKVAKLEQALKDVRQLKELLPICAWCMNIRREDGYWEEVSRYISSHSNTRFTHGICGSCLDKVNTEDLWPPNVGPSDGCAPAQSLREGRLHPCIDVLSEYRQRHRPIGKHHVVEFAQVEAVSESVACRLS